MIPEQSTGTFGLPLPPALFPAVVPPLAAGCPPLALLLPPAPGAPLALLAPPEAEGAPPAPAAMPAVPPEPVSLPVGALDAWEPQALKIPKMEKAAKRCVVLTGFVLVADRRAACDCPKEALTRDLFR